LIKLAFISLAALKAEADKMPRQARLSVERVCGNGYTVIFHSGQPIVKREETEGWIRQHLGLSTDAYQLFMHAEEAPTVNLTASLKAFTVLPAIFDLLVVDPIIQEHPDLLADVPNCVAAAHPYEAAAHLESRLVDKMAAIMLEARQSNIDVAETLAAALEEAADILENAEALVAGRPGSWEAALVLQMINEGGDYSDYSQELVPLLQEMAQMKADGGDMLSRAMGQAVDAWGSLDTFLAGSRWEMVLRGLACQYSKFEYGY